jgi:amino-acid N-acetyltransferase
MPRGGITAGLITYLPTCNNTMNYTLIPADSPALRQQVIDLLTQNNLPTSDLDADKKLYALLDEQQQLAGTGGLEFIGNTALLRSVSVKKELQGKGLGKKISNQLEKIVSSKGVNSIYLLTTTAKNFFERESYNIIDRDLVPQEIKNTSEFSSVCPSSAVVMKKTIATK